MFGELAVPSHVNTLHDIHEEEESDEDGGEIPVDEFHEDDGPLNHVEGLRHVHHTAKDLAVVSEEVTDGFNDNPGAHEGRALGLVGKLEIVKTKSDAKEENDNPVQDLQN